MSGRMNLDLNLRVLVEAIVLSIIHAIIIFTWPALTTPGLEQAGVGGLFVFGTVVFSCLNIAMQIRIMMIASTWTVTLLYSLAFSLFLYILFLTTYSLMFFMSPQFYWVPYKMVKEPLFWVVVVAVPCTALSVDYFIDYIRRECFPTYIDAAIDIDFAEESELRVGARDAMKLLVNEVKDELAEKAAEAGNLVVTVASAPLNVVRSVRKSVMNTENRKEVRSLDSGLEGISEVGDDEPKRPKSEQQAARNGRAQDMRTAKSKKHGSSRINSNLSNFSDSSDTSSSSSSSGDNVGGGFAFSHPGETTQGLLQRMTSTRNVDSFGEKLDHRGSNTSVSSRRGTKERKHSKIVRFESVASLNLEVDSGLQNRPADDPFYQQRMRAWTPVLKPKRVIYTMLVIGIIMMAVGFTVLSASDSVKEIMIQYDGKSLYSGNIIEDRQHISQGTDYLYEKVPNGTTRNISILINHTVPAPVYVFYALTEFYQNERRYMQSFDSNQLSGYETTYAQNKQKCKFYYGAEENPTFPCGLQAHSMFNDTFTVMNSDLQLDSNNIAWRTDKTFKYGNPKAYPGFCNATAKNCLYDEYPSIITKEEGLLNEHFLVWMRLAGLPNFRKPYAKIDKDLVEGTILTVEVQNNFPVNSFGGTKSLVLSSASWVGGKNAFLGGSMLGSGSIIVIIAICISVKETIYPRLDYGESLVDFDSLAVEAGIDSPSRNSKNSNQGETSVVVRQPDFPMKM
jgi:hypothetical protein